MAALTKKVCPRCNGAGNYSFNLVRGTVCFKCNGSKYVLVSADKEKKSANLRAAKAAKQEAMRDLNSQVYRKVCEEMNAKYGQFDIDTPLGIDQLNLATGKATGKALRIIRDERVAKLLER